MTEVRAPKMWHVYGRETPDGPLGGCWLSLTISPEVPQEMPRVWRGERGKTAHWNGLPYLASFDHEPTDEEMEALKELHSPEHDDAPSLGGDR